MNDKFKKRLVNVIMTILIVFELLYCVFIYWLTFNAFENLKLLGIIFITLNIIISTCVILSMKTIIKRNK